MKKIKLLSISWILAFIVVAAQTSLTGKEESTAFQGIADSREIIVNYENPVQIKSIHVVPGEQIERGKVLVELERPELNMKINDISHQLEELKTQQLLNKDEIRGEIRKLKAEKNSAVCEIDHKIQLLESKYKINKEIVHKLKSIENFKSISSKSDVTDSKNSVEIENLKKERNLTAEKFQIDIDNLNSRLAYSGAPPATPDTIRKEYLENELEHLYEEKKALVILSPIDGIIGSIQSKAGEKISSFEPILTLHTRSPSYVRGYIHENLYNLASAGDKVKVYSLAGDARGRTAKEERLNNVNNNDKDAGIEGKIVGVGSRIVEYPVRLRKRPEMQLWGREIEILLPEGNPFLLGEKVVIKAEAHNKSINLSYLKIMAFIKKCFDIKSYAAELKPAAIDSRDEAGRAIISSEITGGSKQIEASGLIYLNDLDRYLVISDETKGKQGIVYLMDEQAGITDCLKIEGLGKIDDMEAICQDESGIIYIACSQSQKKSGKLPDERKLFVKVSRRGTQLIAEKSLLLYDILKQAALENPDKDWAGFIRPENTDIEIEGMFIYGSSLYLGFKKPLKENQAVIIKIDNFNKMLENNHIDKGQMEIWRAVDISHNGGGLYGNIAEYTGISDICLYKNQLIILSCGKIKNTKQTAEEIGTLHVFNFEDGKLIKTRYFNELNPEGIAFDSYRSCFVITFDQGSDAPSRVMRLKNI